MQTTTTDSNPPTLRVVIVGLGVQGRKRLAIAGREAIATVDPHVPDADFQTLDAIDIDTYDAALLCVPDSAKPGLLNWLFARKKHALVEKPLVSGDRATAAILHAHAQAAGVVCYSAYNHRFEPHFREVAQAIHAGTIGQIYRLRLFYGNGTAADVRASAWRDSGSGVLHDLGSHLLDTLLFWLGDCLTDLCVQDARRFENRAFDSVLLSNRSGTPSIELEMSLLSWRNHFTADIYGAKGSLHIDSLCKWGPSTLVQRTRVLPSGRPPERSETLVMADPTWQAEYDHFKVLCQNREIQAPDRDIAICDALHKLSTNALDRFPA